MISDHPVRLYVLSIVLPSLALALGGCLLLGWEWHRAMATTRDAMQMQAIYLSGELQAKFTQLGMPQLGKLEESARAGRLEEGVRAVESLELVNAVYRWGGGPADSLPAWMGPGVLPPVENPAAGGAGERKGLRPWNGEVYGWVMLGKGEGVVVEFSRAAALRMLQGMLERLLEEQGKREDLVEFYLRHGLCVEVEDVQRGEVLCRVGGEAWPGEGVAVGETRMAPLVPRWRLRVAWTAPRIGLPILLGVGGCLALLLGVALSAGGWALLRILRREQREAREKTDFVSNVAHELKTPLTGIRLQAEMLMEGCVEDAEGQTRALEAIVAESDRLSRLVGNVLDFGRLERGRREFACRELDVGAVAASVVSGMGGAGRIAEGEGAGVRAWAEEDGLRQILTNLLDNARKYAGGGAEVKIAKGGAGRVEVRVADRGPGIPEGERERIFERFYRIDMRTTQTVGGSGLGLSLARSLARGMGGELRVEGRAGGGSEFVLELNQEQPTSQETKGN